MLNQFILVGIGGFVGASLRFAFSLVAAKLAWAGWAWTLSVNLVGCAVIGILAGWAGHITLLNDGMRLLVVTGILGGFTTYSAFGMDAVSMLHSRDFGLFALYVGMHLLGGVTCVWLGFRLAAGPVAG